MAYNWPGNVRELQNLVERLCTIIPDASIRARDISAFDVIRKEIKHLTLREAVSSFERQYISEVLENVSGNKGLAAEMLGIHRNTLLAKTNELGLTKK